MEYKLKDLCKIKHGYAFKGKDIIKEETKYILVTPGNFSIGGGFKEDKCKYFNEDGEIPEDYILKENDLIVTMTDLSVNSDTLGYAALVPKKKETIYLHNQRIGLVYNIKEDIILKEYLYWFMRTHKYQRNVVASQSGTAIHHTSPDRILNISIDVPDILIQKRIVKILKDIDEKIELNNQINDNLFKFAVNYVNNKIEEKEVPISKFTKIQGGYAFKSKDLLDSKTKNRIIKIKNLRSEINADVVNSQYIEDEVASSIDDKFKLNKGDVTIAMTGAELGKTGIIYGFDNYYLNQRVGVIRGKNKEGELYLKILFLSDEFQTFLNSKGYGSAQPNISTSDIESILVNDITEKNLKDIYERLNAIYYRIISNCEENLNLEQLRDTLLPKLMNGEIDLDKIEI